MLKDFTGNTIAISSREQVCQDVQYRTKGSCKKQQEDLSLFFNEFHI